MPFSRLLSVFLLLLILWGCRKPSGTNWDVDMALPVAHSRLNISNYVSDTLISADSTGLLHVLVNQEVASLLLDSLLNLPSTSIADTLMSPFQATLNPGEPLPLTPKSDVRFDIDGGVEIAFADIREGMLTVDFSNQVTEPLDLVYRIPSATRDGQVLEVRETVPPGEHSLKKSYDLSGYRLNMRGENGNTYNTLVQAYTIALNPQSPKVVVPQGKGAIIELSFSRIVPEYVEGYFGQSTFDITSDTTDFGVLNNFKADNFMLSEATMQFRILNEFGADFRASLSGITSINSVNASSVTLTHDRLARIPINWPTRVGGAVKASTTTILFNSANSNIVPFISNFPDRISYQGSVSINPPPAGDAVGHTNYAYYGKGIRILADVDIPVKFRADRFRLESVAETDFRNSTQLDNIRSGNIIIDVNNGFPFSAHLQIYMRDENQVIIDSLFTTGSTIGAAYLDGANKVTAPSSTALYVPVNQAKAGNLRRCRSLKIISSLIMPPYPPDVAIYEDYEFEVKIRAEVSYNVGIR
jgi:hypothetical protein